MSAGDAADGANGEVHDYQVCGDYVISSEESPAAWIRSPFTVDLTEAR
ncbi:hypothetical protein [Halorubrum sp. HHNYT27]